MLPVFSETVVLVEATTVVDVVEILHQAQAVTPAA